METNFQENKKIAKQSFEAFEKNDTVALEKITDTSNFLLHFPGQPQPLNFKDALKLNNEYSTAFPDTKVNIENQVAEGDFVVSRVSFEGTHKGTFQGIAPTNKKITMSGLMMQKIQNGKIIEEWDEFDTYTMLKQMGVVPETAEHPQD